jgi:hypothetical protein
MNNIDINLIKAIFAAGFRIGRNNGIDAASAYECGSCSYSAQDWETAWKEDIQWMIDTDTSSHLDINDIKSWENV